MDFITKIAEWLKLSPKYLTAILICCLILIYSPDEFIKNLNLLEFRDQYKSWIGFGFLGSLSILVAHFAFALKNNLVFRYNIKKYKTELKYLTKAEKEILNHYIKNDLITEEYRYSDGVVSALESKMILARASSMSSMGDYFPYIIQPWAAKYLKKHPELLRYKKS